MPVTKQEAQAKRGGQEMKKIFNVAPRIPSVKRPHTVDTSSVNFFRYGHSNSLTKHEFMTSAKNGPRDRPVLKQRNVGYPVCVPDLAKESVDENMFRRTAHKQFLSEDKKMFRKKFFAECTSDHFKQGHLIRHYLNTMHPYSDPLDRGRTYNMSRLKDPERNLDPMPSGDFLQPNDPVRPRSTGYSAGHTRTILGLDSFGPESSKRLELARMVGELPASPNVDRERTMNRSQSPNQPNSARSTSTVSTAPGSADGRRGRGRPKTMGDLDNAAMYLPPNMTRLESREKSREEDGRSHNYQTNNREVSGESYDQGRVTNTSGNAANLSNIHGFDPVSSNDAGSRGHSRSSNRSNKSSGMRNMDQRAATANAGTLHVQMFLPDDEGVDGQHTARSFNSRTSRGGHRPPGVPKPPNANTQTGTLGYHGQAIAKDDLIMKDPIGRGIEWFTKLEENRKKGIEERQNRIAFRAKREKIKKDADNAVVDLEAFDIALEFRRTAKPADLPENNTKRSKLKAQTQKPE